MCLVAGYAVWPKASMEDVLLSGSHCWLVKLGFEAVLGLVTNFLLRLIPGRAVMLRIRKCRARALQVFQ